MVEIMGGKMNIFHILLVTQKIGLFETNLVCVCVGACTLTNSNNALV